jgi:hypothetical protein
MNYTPPDDSRVPARRTETGTSEPSWQPVARNHLFDLDAGMGSHRFTVASYGIFRVASNSSRAVMQGSYERVGD